MTSPYYERVPFKARHSPPEAASPAPEAGMLSIEELLSKKIGLEPESIGRRNIAGAVNTRMELSMVDSVDKYLHMLESDPEELEALIEDVTVSETWFFRDAESFNYLKKYADDIRSSSFERSMFKVLSVPCSTGEEPYSIAITLLEAGLLPEHFQIDAIDINPKTIETAKRAVYGKGAFRGENRDHKDKYFTCSEEGFILDPAIAGLVNFYQDNFVHPHALEGQGHYQVIYCKNLLIYLTDDARKKVFDNINRLLLPNGIIFTGHAELIPFLQYGYKAVKHSRSFACMKIESEAEETSVSHKAKRQKHLLQNHVIKTKGSKQLRFCVTAEPLPRRDSTERGIASNLQSEAETLAAIRVLADGGSLDKALSGCEQFLKKHKHNKEAYYLMGLINLALNVFDKAEAFFQKALYLDPSYYEALLHMKLLHEKKGDLAKASVVNERIKRFQEKI
ncbi:MAG: hypothetical protein NT178_14555 [Proteobacteria bacterium]|nr:hypothetical protein [Pseudomonadota bacterium]